MPNIKKNKTLWGAAIGAVSALFTILLFLTGTLGRLEWITYDQRVVLHRSDKAAHPDVAVIMIDESSLSLMNDSLGRFPWPRAIYGDLLDFLALGEPRAVIFDILFIENQKEAGTRPGRLGGNDRRLVQATRDHPFTYYAMELFVELPDTDGSALSLKPLPADFRKQFMVSAPSDRQFLPYNRYGIPFKKLYQTAKGVGTVGLRPERDGIVRSTSLFEYYGGEAFPALSTTALVANSSKTDISFPEMFQVDGITVPMIEDETFLFNMYGQYQEYSIGGIFSSMASIVNGDIENLLVNPAEFKDKIIYIGTSAAGLQDIKQTSLGLVPGVLIHATVTSNILAQDFMQPVDTATTILLIVLVAGLTVLGILRCHRVIEQIAIPLGLVLLYIVWATISFGFNIAFDVIPPVTAIILVWLSTMTFLTFTEGKDKRKVRRMLSQYVSKAVLAEVVDKYENTISTEIGRKEHVSILFSDIREFTNIAESQEPEAVVEILNAHLGAMSDVIINGYNGTLDKFIGDAIMAFWGAPIRDDSHPYQAVEAALAMYRRLQEVNHGLEQKGFPRIDIGIGIHTGDVVLGNIGSEQKLDYTIIGDSVNLASRVEGLTKQYHCPILISEATRDVVEDRIPCAIVDLVRVKGKQEAVGIYMPLVSSGAKSSDRQAAAGQAEIAKAAFAAYLSRRWKQAITFYSQLPESGWTELAIARCRSYQRKAPVKSWDGISTLSSK